MKSKLLTQRLATFRTKKAADARIMAECARVAKDVVFVAADDSQAVITAEMRELISEALDLLADTEDYEASAPSAVGDAKARGFSGSRRR